MRSFSKVYPQFWTGPTGRAIRKLGGDHQLLASYLFTSPHANSLGLYYLPVEFMLHEVAIDSAKLLDTLKGLCNVDFANYDEETEFVWVFEMAKFQIGEHLERKDNRVQGVNKEYQALAKNPFLAEFFDKYSASLHLEKRRSYEGASKPLGSPIRGTNLNLNLNLKGSSLEGSLRGDEAPAPEDPFETFWAHYPRHKEKKATFRKWKETLKRKANGESQPTAADLIAAAKNYAVSVKGSAEGFIKLGKTFLGPDEPWRDYVAGPSTTEPQGGAHGRPTGAPGKYAHINARKS